MSRMYFYEQAGQQAGPIAGDQLVTNGVRASTLIWREGMPDWVAAGMVPELSDFFAPTISAPTRPALSSSAHQVKPVRPRMPPSTPVRSVFTGKNILMGIVVLLAFGAEVASRTEPDSAVPELKEQQRDAPAQEEEIKEIGYAANHLHDEDAEMSTEEAEVEEPVVSKPITHYWYGCASCGKLFTASKEPGYSKCPAKTGISGTDHSWSNLGEIGDKQYTCYFCSASVSTQSRPESGKCLMSPNKGGVFGLGHQWEESGVSITRNQ